MTTSKREFIDLLNRASKNFSRQQIIECFLWSGVDLFLNYLKIDLNNLDDLLNSIYNKWINKVDFDININKYIQENKVEGGVNDKL